MTQATDEVFIEGLLVYGYHGVNPEERVLGQRLVIDVHLRANLRDAGATDDLDQTINYSSIAKRIRSIAETRSRNLIEAVAHEIAETLLREFARAEHVTVTIRKPAAPIRGGFFDAAGVRINRSRSEVPLPQ